MVRPTTLARTTRGFGLWKRVEALKMGRYYRILLTIITTMGVSLSSLAHAQQINASVTGVVADQNKSMVPNASVLIESAQLAVRRATKTNSDGYFIVTNLPVGLYQVTVEAEGFASFVQENVKVDVGNTLSMNITLSVK